MSTKNNQLARIPRQNNAASLPVEPVTLKGGSGVQLQGRFAGQVVSATRKTQGAILSAANGGEVGVHAVADHFIASVEEAREVGIARANGDKDRKLPVFGKKAPPPAFIMPAVKAA